MFCPYRAGRGRYIRAIEKKEKKKKKEDAAPGGKWKYVKAALKGFWT